MCARGNPGPHGCSNLVEHRTRGSLLTSGGLGEPLPQLLGDHVAHDPAHRGRPENLFRLALELRLGEPDGDNGCQPLDDVVLGDRGF